MVPMHEPPMYHWRYKPNDKYLLILKSLPVEVTKFGQDTGARSMSRSMVGWSNTHELEGCSSRKRAPRTHNNNVMRAVRARRQFPVWTKPYPVFPAGDITFLPEVARDLWHGYRFSAQLPTLTIATLLRNKHVGYTTNPHINLRYVTLWRRNSTEVP